MANKINKVNSSGTDILQVISWKEIFQIYMNSVVIVIYILLKNIFKFFQRKFDKHFGATRQKIERLRQLSMLSISAGNGGERQKSVDSKSICPCTLTTRLGVHKYIKIKSTRFHYVESGSENESVIILLHGFPDCFLGWRNQIPVLSKEHRVLALDLKGFNDSDKPQMRHHYRPDILCSELKFFIDALKIKSVCIIGHDLGALLGWIFALKYPENVSKFISISTPHPNLYWQPTKGGTLSKYFFNMVQVPILPERELSRENLFIHETFKDLCDENENGCVGNFSKSNLIETYEYMFHRSADWTGALNYYRNLPFYRVNTSLMLKCPCILIYGTENVNFRLDSAIRSAELCKNPLIKVIDGASYWVHQTKPKEVNEILLKHLSAGKNENNCEGDKSSGSLTKSLMSRMMNKVYSVGQQYGNISSNYSSG